MSLAHRAVDILIQDRILYGRGRLAELDREVRAAHATRAFIVAEPWVVHAGVTERIRVALEAAGIAAHVHVGPDADPGTASVVHGSRALAVFGTVRTVVVVVGGSASMAAAKAISLHALNGGDVPALGRDRAEVFPGLPLLAVPVAGDDGAECTSFGTIRDEPSGRRSHVGHPSVRPLVTILDPDLALALPPSMTAANGADTLGHALESLVSVNRNPFAEALSLQVIRTVAAWLPVAVADGTHMEARGRLLMAAHLAGLAQSTGAGPGPAHAIAVAIARAGAAIPPGARMTVAHGAALAAIAPGLLAFHAAQGGLRERELALCAVALGAASPADDWASAAGSAVTGLDALLRRVGLRPSTADLGIDPDRIAAVALDAAGDPAIEDSPRVATIGDVEAIISSAAG